MLVAQTLYVFLLAACAGVWGNLFYEILVRTPRRKKRVAEDRAQMEALIGISNYQIHNAVMPCDCIYCTAQRAIVQPTLDAMKFANEKAKVLFLRLLTDEQRESFLRQGCFEAIGGKTRRIYTIVCFDAYGRPIYSHNIQERTATGVVLRSHCCYPMGTARYGHPEYIPYHDTWLGQKLFLESLEGEEAFLKTAYASEAVEIVGIGAINYQGRYRGHGTVAPTDIRVAPRADS